MGGGSHRPPRLDKKHLTPRSPRLSRPVPTCRSCGFMRGHKSRGGNIGIPFLWREIQQAARCHNVSTLHISILPSSGIHISIQHQDMVNHIYFSPPDSQLCTYPSSTGGPTKQIPIQHQDDTNPTAWLH